MHIKKLGAHPSHDLALDTIDKNKQSIVFVESKQSAEKTAEEIAKLVKKHKKAVRPELAAVAEQIKDALGSPTHQCIRLAQCVEQGIAFHHAGLVAVQRELIEDNFKKGIITTICAPPTLAYGVDTPAYRVIMKTLKRYGTSSWGMNWIPVLDYLQCAGRAGRPNFHDDHGEAVVIAKDDIERDEIVAQYIHGKPESIFSKLAVEPVLRTYVLSLIAIGFARTKQQLITFFGKTFWAHQYKDMIQLERIIDKMLLLLDKWGFILQNKLDDFVSADELGKDQTIRATPLGKRVAELYLDPFTAFHLIKGMRTLKEKMYSDFGILQLISCTLEMRPLLRMRVKDHEFVQAALLEHYSVLLMMEPSTYDPTYDDFVDSVKTALFFIEWIDEKTEEELLEMFNIRPGESRTKISNADWLLYALSELLPLMGMHERVSDVKKMRTRVQYGVKEELLTLLRLEGVGRVRARKLHRNGLKDLGALKKVDELTLSSIVGKAIAQNIKKQLGEEDVVVLGVRKGQMGLAKYDAEETHF